MNSHDDLAKESVLAFDGNDSETTYSLAENNWPAIEESLPVGIGEACRHAFIRHAEAKTIDQHLWRARALTAAVITGARDTAAGLLIQAAFISIDDANKGRLEGSERGYELARMILEEIRRLVPEDDQAWLQPWGRLYHNKRGYSFLEEGTHGVRPTAEGKPALESAEIEYELALERTPDSDERGRLKTRGALALIRYLMLADKPADEVRRAKLPFLEETQSVRAAAAARDFADVARWAATNVDTMEAGVFEGWAPYEVE